MENVKGFMKLWPWNSLRFGKINVPRVQKLNIHRDMNPHVPIFPKFSQPLLRVSPDDPQRAVDLEIAMHRSRHECTLHSTLTQVTQIASWQTWHCCVVSPKYAVNHRLYDYNCWLQTGTSNPADSTVSWTGIVCVVAHLDAWQLPNINSSFLTPQRDFISILK